MSRSIEVTLPGGGTHVFDGITLDQYRDVLIRGISVSEHRIKSSGASELFGHNHFGNQDSGGIVDGSRYTTVWMAPFSAPGRSYPSVFLVDGSPDRYNRVTRVKVEWQYPGMSPPQYELRYAKSFEDIRFDNGEPKWDGREVVNRDQTKYVDEIEIFDVKANLWQIWVPEQENVFSSLSDMTFFGMVPEATNKIGGVGVDIEVSSSNAYVRVDSLRPDPIQVSLIYDS